MLARKAIGFPMVTKSREGRRRVKCRMIKGIAITLGTVDLSDAVREKPSHQLQSSPRSQESACTPEVAPVVAFTFTRSADHLHMHDERRGDPDARGSLLTDSGPS